MFERAVFAFSESEPLDASAETSANALTIDSRPRESSGTQS
jgi:hypothetical protein